MAHIRKRSVLGTSTTTGTGALTLSTTAVSGFRSVQSVCAVNDTFKYRIWAVDASGNATGEWEDGYGTYSATDTLTRTEPLSGSAATPVNFSAGTKWVAIVQMEHDTLSPAQITAVQNDYNPTGNRDADIWRLTTDQARRISGIASGWDGRRLTIVNANTTNDGYLILNYEDTGSAAANRFAFERDIVLDPGGIAQLLYDGTTARWRLEAYPGAANSAQRWTPFYMTDFIGAATADTGESAWALWDLSLLSTGTQAKVASAANHPGILRIVSSTTTNSGAFIRTSVDAIRLGGGEVAEFKFQIDDLTTATIRLGFIDTATSADCVDGAYIEIPSTGAAVGKTSSNSTRTTSATIATLTAGNWYRARIEVDRTAANVIFTLFDDAGNQLGTVTNSANIPTAAGRETGHGIIGTKSGTTAQNIFQVDQMSIEWKKALI